MRGHCSLLSVKCLLLCFGPTLLLFPEHEVFEKGMVGSEVRDAQSGNAVANAAFKNETANERRGPGGSNAQGSCERAFIEHLLRRQRRVTFPNHTVMISSVLTCVMQEVAPERFHPRSCSHLDGLVNVTIAPATAGPVV